MQSIELYDHEVLAIEKGPLRWMTSKQHSRMNLESFRRGAEEQFAQVGLLARVNAKQEVGKGPEDEYGFVVEIYGRVDSSHQFDWDRQVHEVVNNILEEPGKEKGFIKTQGHLKEIADANPNSHKCTGSGCC